MSVVFRTYHIYLLKDFKLSFGRVLVKFFRIIVDNMIKSLTARKDLVSRYCTFPCINAATKLAILIKRDWSPNLFRTILHTNIYMKHIGCLLLKSFHSFILWRANFCEKCQNRSILFSRGYVKMSAINIQPYRFILFVGVAILSKILNGNNKLF